VLWDTEDERGWIVNGTTALLHVLRASIESDRKSDVGSTCLMKPEMMQDAEEPHSAGSAMKVLLNPEYRELNLFKNKDGYDKVQDRIEHFVHTFEKIIDHQIRVATANPTEEQRGNDPHEHLEGWDFMDLADRGSPLYPCMDTIPTADQSWTGVVRALNAVTLFGVGFGNLIQPENSCNLCNYWEQLPKNRHYLATLTSDFGIILKLAHRRLDNPQTLFHSILRHHPNRPVQPCPCSNGSVPKHAESVRILQTQAPAPASRSMYWNIPETLGAVLLGVGPPDAHPQLASKSRVSILPIQQPRDYSHTHEAESAPDLSRIQMSVRPVTSPMSQLSLKRRSSNHAADQPASERMFNDAISALDKRRPCQPTGRSEFQIAILCALPIEADAVQVFFDGTWCSYGQHHTDKNTYTVGHIAKHNVVLVHMAGMGKREATRASVFLNRSFEGIKLGLVVGIYGAIPYPTSTPPREILLGDVIISTDLVQYDLGKQYPTGFVKKDNHHDNLSRPDGGIRSFLNKITGRVGHRELVRRTASSLEEACKRPGDGSFKYPGLEKDKLYDSSYRHQHQDSANCINRICAIRTSICDEATKKSCVELGCDVERLLVRQRLKKAQGTLSEHPTHTDTDHWIHFGYIASGDTVMKSGEDRDRKGKEEKGILGFEMEGAGAWEEIPTIVIKGACDYADSHKNDDWHWYAAVSAAACMKALLQEWPVFDGGQISGVSAHKRQRV
jgi:nucleoside phosphorylase